MHALVLAGGSGTRFWPMSRKSRPKQLIALDGELSMLARTIRRLDGLVAPEHAHVILGESLVEATRDALPSDMSETPFIIEPCARNTCPAIVLGALRVLDTYGDEVVVVLPSDHFVRDEDAFRQHIERAARVAELGYIVTLGIEPTRPETGFGYIRFADDEISQGARSVASFVEKPDAATALAYLEDGHFLWNAGIFVFKPSVLKGELERQLPDMAAAFAEIASDGFSQTSIAEIFPEMQSVSIDYGIMEGAENIAVLPSSFGWSDVGHWAALHEIFDADDAENVVVGNAVTVDLRNSVIYNTSQNITAAVANMDGVVVVLTDDAVLVIPRDEAQDVRKIVDALATHDPSRL